MHHAACSVKPKRRPACQHRGMNLVHDINGVEQVGLTCAGRATTHIHASDGALAAKDYSASGERLLILCMTHLDSMYLRDGVRPFHRYDFFWINRAFCAGYFPMSLVRFLNSFQSS